MNNTINAWNVREGHVSFLGESEFSPEDVKALRKNVASEIRSLCKKVLQSEKGSQFATERYGGEGKLDFAVGFSDAKGLCLLANGEEKQILTKEEVYRGDLSVLGEIKKIASAAERQRIGKGNGGRAETDEKVKQAFADFVKERVNEPKSPSLMNRVRARLEVMWGSTDIVSVGRNMAGAVAPAAISVFGALAILGGSILSFAGAALTLSSADSVGLAILNKSREKLGTSLVNLLTGFAACMTGVLFLMDWIAHFSTQIVTAAAAGAALLWAALGLYICATLASIYKVIVSVKFRFELQKQLGDGKDLAKLREALVWLRQKVQLSQLEVQEHKVHAGDNDQKFFEKISSQLHNKWDEFAFRTGKEVLANFTLEKLDQLIETVVEGNGENTEAKDLITKVLDNNWTQIKWGIISVVGNLIGLVAVSCCLAFTGHVISIATSALFAFAAFISIFVDSPKVRELVSELLTRIGKKLSELSQWAQNNLSSSEKIKKLAARVFNSDEEEKTLDPLDGFCAKAMEELSELEKKEEKDPDFLPVTAGGEPDLARMPRGARLGFFSVESRPYKAS